MMAGLGCQFDWIGAWLSDILLGRQGIFQKDQTEVGSAF